MDIGLAKLVALIVCGVLPLFASYLIARFAVTDWQRRERVGDREAEHE
jgi:hypothetical protein